MRRKHGSFRRLIYYFILFKIDKVTRRIFLRIKTFSETFEMRRDNTIYCLTLTVLVLLLLLS